MSDIIEYIKSWSALKWVILVLIAGFIGQFGRMTAEVIVKKLAARRAKKEKITVQNASSSDQVKTIEGASGKTATQAEIKERQEELEKKRLKAMAKAAKKASKKK